MHRLLAPGGLLLDLQPVPPSPAVERDGRVLGRVDQSAQFERFALTQPAVAAVVVDGLFALEAESELDEIERFEQPERLLARAAELSDWVIAPELAEQLRAGSPPVDVRDRLRLRVLRRRP